MMGLGFELQSHTRGEKPLQASSAQPPQIIRKNTTKKHTTTTNKNLDRVLKLKTGSISLATGF